MLRSVARRMQRLREVTDFFSRLKEETGKIKKRQMIEEFVISHQNDKQLVFDIFEIGTMRYKPSSLSKMFFLTQEKVIKSCALLADPESENAELTWAEFMRTIEELKTMSGANLFERQRVLFNSIFSKKARKVDFEFVQKVLLNSLSLGASLATFKQAVRNCIGKEGWGPSDKQSFESLINQSLEEGDFQFFVPIESQLAKSTVSAEDLQKDLRKQHGEVLHIEPKLDGERLQIHVDLKTQKILMFTRKLANVTKRYLFAIPTILAECEKMGLRQAIFDGEIMAWNLDFNGFGSFQDLKSISEENSDEELVGEFRFFIFDMIAKDGSFLLDQNLASRREMLEEAFGRSGPLEFLKLVECKKIPVDKNLMPGLKEEFNSAKKKGYEGLIVKLARSPYLVRSRKNWFKLKFFEKSGKETLDLVIVGAQKGRGALEGTYGSLVCAVRDSNGKLLPVTKLSLAMSAPERAKLTEKIDALRVEFPAPGVEDLSADFYLKPELVFEVAFDCFSLSQEYPVGRGVVDERKGISLRFPVIIRQREDKGVKDATTVDELIAQFQALAGESGHSQENSQNDLNNQTEESK